MSTTSDVREQLAMKTPQLCKDLPGDGILDFEKISCG